MKLDLSFFCSPFVTAARIVGRSWNRTTSPLGLVIVATSLIIGTAAADTILPIYSDDFDDNTNTGWTYVDRSGGTAIMTSTGGGPGSPSFVEQNGQLEQTALNYAFAVDAAGQASLGGIALSGSGIVTADDYTITADFDSFESGNVNQDHWVVFAYEDEDNFWFAGVLANSTARLIQIDNGVNTLVTSISSAITFSHDLAPMVVDVNTFTGTVSITYGAGSVIELGSGLTIADGQNGVGSNNDGYAIDNYSITEFIDETPPALVLPTSPADNATGVLVATSLMATFDELVALEDGGTITIDDLDGGTDTVITLPDPQATVSGADLIIIPGSPLATNTNYAIKISNDAVKDIVATPNFFAGIADETTWNFLTASDGTAPMLALPTTPADGATDAVVDANLVADFDEAIAGGSGNITIRNLSMTSDVVIPVGDAQVSISGNTLTIDPSSSLNPNDDYAIQIDAGAITDLIGNLFGGIVDDTTWNFTTASDTTAPMIVSLSPADESSLPSSGSLVATFDEDIAALAPTALLTEGFEAGDGGFTVLTTAGTAWTRGTPDSNSPGGTIDSGNGAVSGSGSCWGTNLGAFAGGAGDPGYYADPTITCLRSAPIDLTGATSAQLTFAQAFDLFAPDDEAVVNIIDDTTDAVIAADVYTVSNGSSNWASSPSIDLIAGVGQIVRIEWCLTGTGGGSDDYLGWYIDDVTVSASTAGGITLKNLTDSTETLFALNDPAVTIAGSSLAVAPGAALGAGDLYAVQIAAGAITDLSGNPFGGILDDSSWNFTVEKTLFPAFDAYGRSISTGTIDRNPNTDRLAVGPVKAGDYFRTYLTFDLTDEIAATEDITLRLVNSINENNTDAEAQVYTLFSLPVDWDGAAQPGPTGTTLDTINITPTTGNDTQALNFSSAALTAAFNSAVGGNLYLGIKSDVEGPAKRSFKWLGSRENAGSEPQLIYAPSTDTGGDIFATWIDTFFPGEVNLAIIGTDEDPDGDGIDNGVENFFGTSPNEFSQGLVAGTADSGAGTFSFTHPQGTLADDLSAAYTWSTDLAAFHPDGPNGGTTVTFSTQADTPTGFTTVTATVTGTPVASLFLRVEVTED